MVNFKETLTKLHSEFPEFDLEKLFKIMGCIVEDTPVLNNVNYTLNRGGSTKYPWGQEVITCLYKEPHQK